MALTGLGLVGFVIAHMLGNLQVFVGRDQLNAYAAGLKNLGAVLWAMRLGLLAMFVVHIATAFSLSRDNRAARPVRYVSQKTQVTSFAARTMLMTGIIVLLFVLYHLAHFTVGLTHPEHFALRDGARHDVYGMVVLGFRDPLVSGLYIAAQVFLCLHISHGASSALHTLGVTHPALQFVKAKLGPALALVIFAGNVSIPAAILLGLVK